MKTHHLCWLDPIELYFSLLNPIKSQFLLVKPIDDVAEVTLGASWRKAGLSPFAPHPVNLASSIYLWLRGHLGLKTWKIHENPPVFIGYRAWMVVFPSYGICAFWDLLESCPMATGGVYTVYPIFRWTHFMIRKTCIFDAFYSLNLVQTSQEPWIWC